MKCPRCRKNIPDDSIFCPECGVKIRQTGFPQSGGNYAAPQKKKFPVAVAVAAVAGVAVIAGGAVYAVKQTGSLCPARFQRSRNSWMICP